MASVDRHQGRILAMQALCQQEVQTKQTDADLVELMQVLEAAPATATFALSLVKSCMDQREILDAKLTAAMTQWSISRLSPVERNVMRIALAEMIGGEVPEKVAIDEAIEIGKEFGGADSPRFINGVLDEAWRRIREETGRGTL